MRWLLDELSTGITPKARDELVADIKTEATRLIAVDFEKALQEKYGAAVESWRRADRMRVAALQIISRLQNEINALERRGNLNLVIGTITTAVAAIMLAYVALTAHLTGNDWHQYLSTYLLRLSVVVFIEIFAFFFLRLYRASLAEIKYFQNEITNIEARCLALEFAIFSDNRDATSKVIEELARTERNFVLAKDQTTIELEKLRLESRQIPELISALKDLLPIQKS